MKNLKSKWREMDVAQLEQELLATRQSLFKLRLNAATGHVKDSSQFKKMRYQIACIQTIVNQKKRSAVAE